MAGLVKQEHGFVDILVNNAGILSGKRLLSLTDNQIQKTIELNVLANFWVRKLCNLCMLVYMVLISISTGSP